MKDDAPRVIKIPAKPETTRQAEARRQLRSYFLTITKL